MRQSYVFVFMIRKMILVTLISNIFLTTIFAFLPSHLSSVLKLLKKKLKYILRDRQQFDTDIIDTVRHISDKR